MDLFELVFTILSNVIDGFDILYQFFGIHFIWIIPNIVIFTIFFIKLLLLYSRTLLDSIYIFLITNKKLILFIWKIVCNISFTLQFCIKKVIKIITKIIENEIEKIFKEILEESTGFEPDIITNRLEIKGTNNDQNIPKNNNKKNLISKQISFDVFTLLN